MSGRKSKRFRLSKKSNEEATAELPTLKVSDIVSTAEHSPPNIDSEEDVNAWVAELESEIESLKDRWREVDAALHRSENRTSELEQQLADKDSTAQGLELALEKAQQEIAGLEQKLAHFEQRDSERDETLRELNRSLQSQTSVAEMLSGDLSKRESELESAKADLTSATNRLKAKDRTIELRKAKIDKLETRIGEQDRELKELRTETASLQEEMQTLQTDLKLKQSMIDAFDKSARRLTDLNKSLKRRSTTLEHDGSLVIEAAHIFELAGGGQSAGAADGAEPPKLPDGIRHVMVQGTGDDRRFYPLTDDEMTIGRSRDCDIWINDETISRVHARFAVGDDGPEIVDAGSTNGIRVNNKDVKSANLKHGDTISLAGTLTLTYVEVQPATESG